MSKKKFINPDVIREFFKEELGISQNDFAKSLDNMNSGLLSRYMNGEAVPDKTLLLIQQKYPKTKKLKFYTEKEVEQVLPGDIYFVETEVLNYLRRDSKQTRLILKSSSDSKDVVVTYSKIELLNP